MITNRLLLIALSLFFQLFYVDINNAEDKKPTNIESNTITPVLVLPADLSNDIYKNGIKNREFYEYEKQVVNETGAVKESELVWKQDNLTTDFTFKAIKLNFRTSDKRFSDSDFTVEIRYPHHDNIEIEHSKPAFPKHKNGLLVRFDKEYESRWGGAIYGNKTAGILYFVARTAHNQKRAPAVLVCPRFIKPRDKSFIVDGTESYLTSIEGVVSGSATAQFRAGYDEGDVGLSLETIGLADNGSGTAELRSKAPKVELAYQPAGLASKVEIKNNEPAYIAISAIAKLRNAAGYLKTESQSSALWAVTKVLPIDEEINITRYLRAPTTVRPKRGQCVLVFETRHINRHYQTP